MISDINNKSTRWVEYYLGYLKLWSCVLTPYEEEMIDNTYKRVEPIICSLLLMVKRERLKERCGARENHIFM